MFFNKGFACFHLYQIEQIDFGNFGDEVWAKFNGVVIGAVRGKLVMGFLGEDICKVVTPFQDDCLC